MLREEARSVRLRARQLRTQLHLVFSDCFEARERLAPHLPRIACQERDGLGTITAEGLLRHEEARRRSGGSLLAVMEEERSRIARELHDDLNQQVAWLQLKVASLQERTAAPPESRDAEFRLLSQGLAELSARISKISHGLHPAILSDLGLETAIRSFVAEFAQYEHVQADFRAQKVPRNIPSPVGLCLYRILQEALRNVAKHSGTKRLAVTLSTTSARLLRLVIRDYGAGIPAVRQRGKGLGLISMEERARLLSGTFRIRSKEGKGTQITVQLPMNLRPGAGDRDGSDGISSITSPILLNLPATPRVRRTNLG